MYNNHNTKHICMIFFSIVLPIVIATLRNDEKECVCVSIKREAERELNLKKIYQKNRIYSSVDRAASIIYK